MPTTDTQLPDDRFQHEKEQAPGKPGQSPHWAPADKLGVGTALSRRSSVWFTIGQGGLTEIFYPWVDTACTRDLQFIVTGQSGFVSAGSTDTYSKVEYMESGVPAYRMTNTCKRGKYRTVAEVLTDPRRAAVLLQVQFEALQGQLDDYSLFAMLHPHIGNQGAHNNAWLGEFKGTPLLFAERDGIAIALACSRPWKKASVGYVGMSDGWTEISKHYAMQHCYERADDGNVALTGEVDIEADDGKFVLAITFGRNEFQAAHQARASLLQGFESARDEYIRRWKDWQRDVLALKGSKEHSQNLYHISAAVMRTHESKHFPGAIVASLAVPWGFAKGDDDLGYHLVWPRDMIETVLGLLAINKLEDARRVVFYFQVTQEADGHWPQNMFLDGRHSWNGIQLDETAFVILLVGIAEREGALKPDAVARLWPMVRAAAGFLVRNGPATPMDRWEEQPGYFASTIAVEIPALLVAADIAERQGEDELAEYLRETADAWNEMIEELIYVTDTKLAREAGVDGYYVRFAPEDQLEKGSPASGTIPLRNHKPGKADVDVTEVVSPDALCLVRFGLREAEDPRIENTLHVIDRVLKVETPSGPCWRRYTHDGYGEHSDGSPYDGTGIGRAWPLLTGERAHFELAAGRRREAERLLRTLESFANDSGLLPEQVWDAESIPERRLFFGRPTGSAMPLVWAHAEYVKLRRSLYDGRVFDMPAQTVERYLRRKSIGRHAVWRFDQKRILIPAGKILRVEVNAPASVRWSSDDWQTSTDIRTKASGLGTHFADLAVKQLSPGSTIVFTFFWTEANRWEGADFRVRVADSVRNSACDQESFKKPKARTSASNLQSARQLSASNT